MCFIISDHFKVVLLVTVLYLSVSCTNTTEDIPLTNDVLSTTEKGLNISGYLQSENYPDPYLPTSGFTKNLTVESGYYIDIIVEDLDIDGASGDYLSIKSDMEQILTWTIKTPKLFRSSNNFVTITFVVQERQNVIEENTHRGFSLKWERSGDLISTTPSSESTTPSINNIPEDQIESIVVYVTTMNPEDFLDNRIQFEEILVEMSNKYCEEHDISLQEEITLNNIIMWNMSYCPITWPNYLDCIQIRFAIPVILNDTTENNNTYELSATHLTEMWKEYSKDMLPTIGLREFPVPNIVFHLEIWIGVSVVIVIFFFILLIVLWKFNFFEMDVRPLNNYNDHNFDYEEDKQRPSDLSLYPLPHQAIPPLFDAPDDLLAEFTYDSTESIEKNHFPLYEPDCLYGNVNNQNELFYSPPPSYATEIRDGNLDMFEYENPAFVNDEENVIFQRNHRR